MIHQVLLDYEAAGVDQVIFIFQSGKLRHEDICASLELFGKTVLPEFKERDERRSREKAARMEPLIEAAMKRRVAPEAPEIAGSYEYRADGTGIRHFFWEPEAKKSA